MGELQVPTGAAANAPRIQRSAQALTREAPSAARPRRDGRHGEGGRVQGVGQLVVPLREWYEAGPGPVAVTEHTARRPGGRTREPPRADRADPLGTETTEPERLTRQAVPRGPADRRAVVNARRRPPRQSGTAESNQLPGERTGPGRPAVLVGHHLQVLPPGGEFERRGREVAAVLAVEPGGAHDVAGVRQ